MVRNFFFKSRKKYIYIEVWHFSEVYHLYNKQKNTQRLYLEFNLHA